VGLPIELNIFFASALATSTANRVSVNSNNLFIVCFENIYRSKWCIIKLLTGGRGNEHQYKKITTNEMRLLILLIILIALILSVQSSLNTTTTTTTLSCYSTQGCIDNFQQSFQKCDGHYCGRRLRNYKSNVFASIDNHQCTSCPYGHKSDGWVCVPCNDKLSTYSIFYLVFMFGLIVMINFISIEVYGMQIFIRLILQLSSLVEVMVATILTIICFTPTFNMKACDIERFSDFYSPTLNPVGGNDCTTDRAYPLYTIVFIHYSICIVLLLLIRIPIMRLLGMLATKIDIDRETLPTFFNSAYVPLWIIPGIALIHFFFVGVIYYAFTYIGLIACAIGDITHTIFICLKRDSTPIWKKICWYILRYAIAVWLIWGIVEFFYRQGRVNFLWLILCFIAPVLFQIVTIVVIKVCTVLYVDEDD
jgi:hypothetical protein